MKIICICVKTITILGIINWVILAIFFLQWKNLYYYPQYDLYLYVDGGIIGNRTVILGQSLDSMNTILRYDSRDVFNFYIGKAEDRFYIYWPEDTTSWHYTSVKNDGPGSSFSYELKEVQYRPYLKKNKLDSTKFSLVTYLHQTPEDWIETYKSWSDTLHWGSPGQLKIYYDTRVSNSYSNPSDIKTDDIKNVDCNVYLYIKLLIRALDKESVIFIFTSLFFVIIYSLCHYAERDNRT